MGLHGGLGNSGVPLAQFVSHSFWVHLGINFQLEALQNATEEQAEALQLGYWSLVGDGPPPWLDKDDDPKSAPTGMGSQYKALAIVSDACGAPIGFQ